MFIRLSKDHFSRSLIYVSHSRLADGFFFFVVHCYVNGHSRISELELILSSQGRNFILVHGYVKQKQTKRKRNAKH